MGLASKIRYNQKFKSRVKVSENKVYTKNFKENAVAEAEKAIKNKGERDPSKGYLTKEGTLYEYHPGSPEVATAHWDPYWSGMVDYYFQKLSSSAIKAARFHNRATVTTVFIDEAISNDDDLLEISSKILAK
jgi:hypothetical protein